MEEEKKKFFKKWWFWVIIAVVIIVLAICIALFRKPSFEVTDFSLEKETTQYTSITSYSGTGIITTNKKKGTYLVAVKVTLKSGGSENSEDEYVTMVTVNNGKGELGTYDYGDSDEIKKPDYDFEIIGYIKF